MNITRRTLLGTAASLAAAPAFGAIEASPAQVAAQTTGKRDYGAAMEAILACARAELAATGLPGMIVSLCDDDGFSASLCLGWADLTSRTPVGPDHLFEIGSISKSLTALTLWKLAAAGKLDLNAPVSRYLPGGLLPPEPITTLQLLDHVSGLPNFAAIPPQTRDGRLWTGPKPGRKFYYSNTGYELAGLVIDAVTCRPHPDVIADLVLRPIGMNRAAAHIRADDRPHMATGYVGRPDLPPLFGVPLVEGPWTEEDLGAGAVRATVGDMIAYLRYVIGLGRGLGGPLFTDATAAAILADSVDAPEVGGRYSSGFMRTKIDERPILHHTGGMLLFSSSFDVDAQAGVGAFASVNGILAEHRPTAVTAFAVRALRAVREGKPLPTLPDPFASRRVVRPERFAGRWVAPDGTALDIVTAGSVTTIRSGERAARVEMLGSNLLTDLPGFTASLLEFSSASKDKTAPFDHLWYLDTPYARDKAPPSPAPLPTTLQPMIGSYRTPNPWVGGFDIVARDGRLAVPGVGRLIADKSGFWRSEEDQDGFERIAFDTSIGGRMHRLIFSGQACVRIE